jgi:cell wall-associated NlpC family hydrolase
MEIQSVNTILENKLARIESRLPAGFSIFGDMLRNTSMTEESAPVSKGQEAAVYAQEFIGTPYAFGASDLRNGTDCSGFVRQVYKSVGVDLPRTAYEQSQVGAPVSIHDLQPGDLLFFKTSDRAPITHVGMWIGDNQFIHSSVSGGGVGISQLNAKWLGVLRATRRVST